MTPTAPTNRLRHPPRALVLLPLGMLFSLAVPSPTELPTTRHLAAQAPNQGLSELAVPRFEISSSPIELSGPARLGEYLGAVGPRSAWLGVETGEAELWVHPLKVGNGFQLSFSIAGYGVPLPGNSIARTVRVRPEAVTIEYGHAAFQVRQHVIAPSEHAGLLVLLEVDSPEPMEVIAEFEPVLNYMWPASIGGQYAYWDGERRAFVLSESLRERNAVVGSPWASNSVDHPAHQLGEAPRTMVIPVDPARAEREFIPIAVAGGTLPRDSVFAIYRAIIAGAEDIYRTKRAWATHALESTASIESPDPQLDLALEWAKINLEEQRVCNPDLGCGFVAGWGLSRNGTRPGFGWFFGGDAAINTFAMDAVGQWALVAEELAFLARYQRDDGKITHEISQAAAHIDWFGTYPYAYYHADTTPYWMLAVSEYWRASADDDTLAELWPAYRRAWEWCLSAETDGDGLVENTVGGLGAVEVGGLGEALHQDVYLAAVWAAALRGTVALAERMGDAETLDEARSILPTALRSLNESYWRSDVGHHAFGILADGSTNPNLTAWPATAASFGLLDDERARLTLAKIAGDRVSSDWGAHMLSTESPLYHPLQYNQGTVWPFVTGFVSWGQYRYRRPWAGFHLMDAVKQMTFDWALGRHGELFSGTYYHPLDATVPHQFFATSMLVTPLLRGMFGWEPDAPFRRARLAPQVPPDWPEATVRRLRAGATSLDVSVSRNWTATGGSATTRLSADGPSIVIDYVPDLPVGSELKSLTVNGTATELTDGAVHVELGDGATNGSEAVITYTWDGGMSIAPPRIALRTGQRSSGMRILDLRTTDNGAWELDVEGDAGSGYDLHLFGTATAPIILEGEARITAGWRPADWAGNGVARIDFAPGNGRVQAVVLLAARSDPSP